ncbi:MAG: glutamate--cysteine ligase [Actinomycetota bacterium]|nr:glutamate--cysteine ligase [Actinomycetota bacterium]
MRTFGVEEEFLVVDPKTGSPLPIGDMIVASDQDHGADARFVLTTELQREQVESVTKVCDSLDQLDSSLLDGRRRADSLAQEFGARIVALGTSPMPVEPHITPLPRYREIGTRFGIISTEQLTCGFHVHVGVASDDEGVGALDRIRVWLPVLLALSANSPFWNGRETGYASYRRAIWTRLPITGPADLFGTAEEYHRTVRDLLASEVVLDAGMVYFDARLSHDHPTVEIRVADVCLDVEVALLIAALARALVETAVREWSDGKSAPAVPVPMVQLAMWRASRSGLQGELLDPHDWRPRKAIEVVTALLDHVRTALVDAGDLHRVVESIEHGLGHGTGAHFQRVNYAITGSHSAVVAMAVERTNMVGRLW